MFEKKNPNQRKTKLRFRTTRQQENNRRRLGWTIFIVVLVLLVLASTVVVLRQTGVSSKIGNRKPDTGSANIQEKFNIMIGGASEDGRLVFLGRLNVDTSSGEMKVKMYNPNTAYNGKTFAQIYEGDRVTAETLAGAFGQSIGETMDRYVIINEVNAASVGYDLGYTTVELKSPVAYSGSNWSVKLDKGKQELGGTNMFSLIRFYGLYMTASGYKEQAKLVAAVIDQALNPENAERGQRIFENLSDDMQTNLGIGDYANYAAFLTSISSMSHSVDVG